MNLNDSTPRLKSPTTAAGEYFVQNCATRTAIPSPKPQQRRNTTGPVLEALQTFEQQQKLRQQKIDVAFQQRPMSLRQKYEKTFLKNSNNTAANAFAQHQYALCYDGKK